MLLKPQLPLLPFPDQLPPAPRFEGVPLREVEFLALQKFLDGTDLELGDLPPQQRSLTDIQRTSSSRGRRANTWSRIDELIPAGAKESDKPRVAQYLQLLTNLGPNIAVRRMEFRESRLQGIRIL